MNPTQTDGNKNPLDFATTDQAPTEPVQEVKSPSGQEVELGAKGKSGTYIFSGIITREEYNNELIRFKALENYDIMRRSDGTVRAALKVCKLPIMSATWHIQSASDDQIDKDKAEFIRQQLFDNLDWSSTLSEILTYLEFGYSVFEKVYDYVDFKPEDIEIEQEPELDENGKEIKKDPVYQVRPIQKLIGLKNLASRKQRTIYRWQTQGDNPVPGITQYVPGGTFSIEMPKLCVFTYDKEGENYEGISMIRPAYKHWVMKDKLELIDGIRHERQGLGIITVEPPEGANEDDINDAIQAARNARASEEGVIKKPKDWMIEFMDMKGGPGTVSDIQTSLEYHKREITKSVLAQFLELGGSGKGSSGSRAVSADHSQLFEMALEHVAKYIQTVINRNVIKDLIDLNYSDKTGYPTLEHSKIGDDDIAVTSTAINQLMSVKAMTPDPELEQALRNMMHLPDLPDDIRDNYDNRPSVTPVADPNNPAVPAPAKPDEDTKDELTKTASDALTNFLSAKERLYDEYKIDGPRIGA